jgi:hypothetical protein
LDKCNRKDEITVYASITAGADRESDKQLIIIGLKGMYKDNAANNEGEERYTMEHQN